MKLQDRTDAGPKLRGDTEKEGDDDEVCSIENDRLILNEILKSNDTIIEHTGEKEQWKQFITLKFVDYEKNLFLKKLERLKFDGGKNYAFFTLHIEIYATNNPANKWIKFKLTDAVGMKSIMAYDRPNCRGFFNESASVYIFPGSGNRPYSSRLPLGWCRPYMEPRTTSSETKYTCTTGWSVGASADANMSGYIPGAKAGINASYNQSKQVECTIPEFKVRNISDGSMTGWKYYYTATNEGKGDKHFDNDNVKPIADLAKSTLTLHAECIYEGPAGTDEIMDWNVQFEPNFQVLYRDNSVNKTAIHKKRFQVKAKINMGLVNILSVETSMKTT